MYTERPGRVEDVADRAVLSGCVDALQNDEQCPLSLSVEMSCSRFISAASLAVAFSVAPLFDEMQRTARIKRVELHPLCRLPPSVHLERSRQNCLLKLVPASGRLLDWELLQSECILFLMTRGADPVEKNDRRDEGVALEDAPPKRRLAAILAADVVGFSRLMHEDEERTLAALTAQRKIVDPLIAEANGQIFNTAGDSVLAEFPSVVEAYHSAVAIQRALFRSKGDLLEELPLEMRIGINVGDVMAKDDEVFGDGVNIACRLEALCEPGGICVTRAVRDQLRDRGEMTFADLGEHQVKNIARPVRVFRVIFDRNEEPELPESVRRTETEEQPPEDASDSDLVEIAFWQAVQASDKDSEYSLYLERYPKGAFADLARARLQGAPATADPSVELSFWETVRASEDAAMLRAYLEKYPRGEFASLAAIMLEKIEQGVR